jgi:hypothetical protein
MNEKDRKQDSAEESKRSYTPPTLTTLGSINELTGDVKSAGWGDGIGMKQVYGGGGS